MWKHLLMINVESQFLIFHLSLSHLTDRTFSTKECRWCLSKISFTNSICQWISMIMATRSNTLNQSKWTFTEHSNASIWTADQWSRSRPLMRSMRASATKTAKYWKSMTTVSLMLSRRYLLVTQGTLNRFLRARWRTLLTSSPPRRFIATLGRMRHF